MKDERTGARGIAGVMCMLVFAAVGYRILTVGRVVPSVYWDTNSYASYARQMAASHRLPPLDERTPGYPAFLWLVGGAGVNFWRVMRAQQALGAASNVLVGWIAWTLIGKRPAALIAGFASLSLPDLLFYENTIYTETLARFLVLAAFAGLAGGLAPGRRRPFLLVFGCAAAGLAPLVRPILVILVPETVALLVAWARSGDQWRKRLAGLGASIAIAPAAALVIWNVSSAHYFGLARAAEKTVADYVGFPAVYEHLPASLQGVREIYETEAHRRNRSIIPFWFALPQLQAYESAHGRVYETDAALLGSIARRCLLACPGGYLRVWLDTIRRFLTDRAGLMGMYTDPDASRAGRPQLAGWRLTWMAIPIAFWRLALPLVVLLASAFPFFGLLARREPAAALNESPRWGSRWGYITMVGVTLMNTALEPFPGQARYRAPIEEIFLILAVVSVSLMIERFENRAGGARDPHEAAR